VGGVHKDRPPALVTTTAGGACTGQHLTKRGGLPAENVNVVRVIVVVDSSSPSPCSIMAAHCAFTIVWDDEAPVFSKRDARSTHFISGFGICKPAAKAVPCQQLQGVGSFDKTTAQRSIHEVEWGVVIDAKNRSCDVVAGSTGLSMRCRWEPRAASSA
jgi:hypothetical protein